MKRALFVCVLVAAAAWAQQRPVQTLPASGGDIRITPVRHASLVIEYGGRVIQVDPWSQGNYAGLPQADLILITDIHGDHFDPKAIAQAKKEGTKIVAPAAVHEKLADAQVLNNGAAIVESKYDFKAHRTGEELYRILAVPMYNLERGPSPGTKYHDKGRGNGYVLVIGGKRIYISGDTECTPEMKALKNIDVAFLSMNLPYTMPPEEAAACAKAFRPKIVYPYHYRGSDLNVFQNALKDEKGIEVRLLDWYY